MSVLVLEEASRGNPEAARLRLDAISDLPVLSLNEKAEELAGLLLDKKLIPQISNAEMRWRIQLAIESMGYACRTICSPDELGGFTQ